MAKQPGRFNRQFLTILIVVTSLAIALLSRLGETPSEGDASGQSTNPPAPTSQSASPTQP